MMSFCKKSVHSFLSLSNMTTTNTPTSSQDSSGGYLRNIQSPTSGGLTFFTVSDDIPRPSNVIEWSSFNSTIGATPSAKGDPSGIGFIDDVGGRVNGLLSCTESLGFESSDERRVVDKIENNVGDGKKTVGRSKKVEKKEVKKFPPPLSTLSNDGKPTFFLRPVRKDGRLELTEVKIHRPEILRASRQDGRLRLHLVQDENDADSDTTTSEEEEDVQEEKVEEERVDDGWRFPESSGGGECFRRCHESMVRHGHHHHHHHHNLHGWGQHCVTIR